MKNRKQKIGNIDVVTIDRDSGRTDHYEDGYERELLSLFLSGKPALKRSKILRNNPSWPLYYHLNPARAGLIDWYEFKKGSRVLEVGSGCGAITEALVKKSVDVTSIELTKDRALINAHRNKSATNLEIIIGNLDKYKPKEKFDYLICVGVMEYAGTYIRGSNPYDNFLLKLGEFIKPGGIILLAIENQLGSKYLAGAKEDHTGGFYDGINNYPLEKGVKTFGRKTLKEIFERSGFRDTFFYYPFPDYKFPFLIYSDDYFPGNNGVKLPRSALPVKTFGQDREYVFSEAGFMSVIEDNNLFRELANSFLVEGRKND